MTDNTPTPTNASTRISDAELRAMLSPKQPSRGKDMRPVAARALVLEGEAA